MTIDDIVIGMDYLRQYSLDEHGTNKAVYDHNHFRLLGYKPYLFKQTNNTALFLWKYER